jgi:hypothetical protein
MLKVINANPACYNIVKTYLCPPASPEAEKNMVGIQNMYFLF